MNPFENITGILIVLIVFAAPAIPILIVGMVYYYKKKLEHKQVLAAIEKGVPVSELSLSAKKQKKNEGPGWVQDQAKAITSIVIGVGIGIAFWGLIGSLDRSMMDHAGMFNTLWIVPIVFLGNGIGLLVRSSQRRKYEKPEPAKKNAEQRQ